MEPVPHCPVPNVDFVTVGIGHSVGIQLHDMPCHASLQSIYSHSCVLSVKPTVQDSFQRSPQTRYYISGGPFSVLIWQWHVSVSGTGVMLGFLNLYLETISFIFFHVQFFLYPRAPSGWVDDFDWLTVLKLAVTLNQF